MKSTITLPRARAFSAAVAYFGRDGAKLLPLKKGDSIVVDMSLNAQGVTSSQGRANAHGTWCEGI